MANAFASVQNIFSLSVCKFKYSLRNLLLLSSYTQTNRQICKKERPHRQTKKKERRTKKERKRVFEMEFEIRFLRICKFVFLIQFSLVNIVMIFANNKNSSSILHKAGQGETTKMTFSTPHVKTPIKLLSVQFKILFIHTSIRHLPEQYLGQPR